MKSPSDDAENDFTNVKPSKFQGKVKGDQTVIDTFNRFQEFNSPRFQVEVTKQHELKEKSDLFTMLQEKDSNFDEKAVPKATKYKFVRKETKIRNKKFKPPSLKRFETENGAVIKVTFFLFL